MNTVFKVCQIIIEGEYKGFWSSHHNPYKSLCSIRYQIGNMSIPIIGGIFVFDNLLNASRFAQGDAYMNSVILECEAKDIKRVTFPLLLDTNFFKIEEFWRRYSQGLAAFNIESAITRGEFLGELIAPPRGTYMTYCLTPIRVAELATPSKHFGRQYD